MAIVKIHDGTAAGGNNKDAALSSLTSPPPIAPNHQIAKHKPNTQIATRMEPTIWPCRMAIVAPSPPKATTT